MPKLDPKRATLGYHNSGDYFYFTVLTEGNQFLGKRGDEEFRDFESFAGLVTAVHEHHHLMQELSQGFFWWQQHTRDLLIANMSQAVRETHEGNILYPLWRKPEQRPKKVMVKIGDPISTAQQLVLELDTILDYWKSPQMTQMLLALEMRFSPEMTRFVNDDILNLTTIDLVECHAAILTELYMSFLLIERPNQFDPDTANALAGLFRVDHMDLAYFRPLRALMQILKSIGVDIRIVEANAHPVYGQIKHGALYVMLAFLLDYALHIPPNPLLLLSQTTDAACQQDIFPPFRFINLVFLFALELRFNRNGYKNILTSEPLYYSKGSPALATLINNMHSSVRRKGLFARKTPDTFFEVEETTKQWLDARNSVHDESLFPLMHTLWSKCLQFRLNNPDFFLKLVPLDFDSAVGVPRVYITGKGLGVTPFFSDEENLDPDQLQQLLMNAMKTHFESFLFGNVDRETIAEYPSTLVPMRFIEEWIAREISYRFSCSILYGEPLRCPLTESIGRYIPCRSRTPACETIRIPKDTPTQGCLFRATVEQAFGNVDKFNRTD